MSSELQSELAEPLPSRFVVGIDLGTTNSAVAYIDTHQDHRSIHTFLIPQIVAPGLVESRDTLPSFYYEGLESEKESLGILPWEKQPSKTLVGFGARDHGSQVSGRQISSAKSWLCHSGVDRTAKLLPWHGADDVTRLTPVDASSRYLSHIRMAWNAAHPHEPLEKQDIVLTLPASFDEVARELTVEAAKQAGLERIILIEEPQAAFYAWIDKHRDNWQSIVAAGQKILVCDVGGGTSDFTLIYARPEQGDKSVVSFHRIAVGDHLLLGGDNLDLALAKFLEGKLASGKDLPARSWDLLYRQARYTKEILLGEKSPESASVSVPSGSRLIGGALQCEVTKGEVESLLVDGFFPQSNWQDEPSRAQLGFQEFGLPFAPDPRVTVYLSKFLREASAALSRLEDSENRGSSNSSAKRNARPDFLLFNGGVFSSPQIRERIVGVLGAWFADLTPGESWLPTVLDNDRLDLAVARGAAYYGMVRRGEGVKISSRLARTYYVGIQGEKPTCVCLVPADLEPGPELEIRKPAFQLLVGTPIEFPIYVSGTRTIDRPGDVLEVDPLQMRALPPIRTVLQTRDKGLNGRVEAYLTARLSEIGTLELNCVETSNQKHWRLQFDVRTATQTDIATHQGAAETQGFLDEDSWLAAKLVIDQTFGSESTIDPEKMMKELAAALGEDRDKWRPSLLRRLWEELFAVEAGRRLSPKHECRWLNLVGFSLRPGYGLALDDWRVSETWKLVLGKLCHQSAAARAESWILWRRVAGGLTAGQQLALSTPLLNNVRQLHRQLMTGKGQSPSFDFGSHEAAEVWRLLGSLERLPLPAKTELGNLLVDLMPKKKVQPTRAGIVWALSRIGAREPVYGLLNNVISKEKVEHWLDKLLPQFSGEPIELLAVMQLARRTGDRYRDISESHRGIVLNWLESHAANESLLRVVREVAHLDSDQQQQVFGDSLPIGLSIS